MGEDVPPHQQQHPYTTKTCIINTTIVMSSLAMLQQLIIGLVLVLAIAHAKVNMVHSDVVLKPRGNWSMDPRASETVPCARRPRSVILNSGDVVTFRSPGYPSQYPSRSFCGWRFKTSAEMVVKVKRVVDHPNYNSPTPPNNDFSLWNWKVHWILRRFPLKSVPYVYQVQAIHLSMKMLMPLSLVGVIPKVHMDQLQMLYKRQLFIQ